MNDTGYPNLKWWRETKNVNAATINNIKNDDRLDLNGETEKAQEKNAKFAAGYSISTLKQYIYLVPKLDRILAKVL
ncbi:hypothetical protein TNCT_353791 [Trichonephila clavata]|uniref:Uncharacterized protein n=1 Tax=Trichonephila clavata TaxID=2740835 RepID=A0A8X6GLA7_TRICU|nr:hypothetical protein TNCT_353791 [Trichonephila clavata]